MFAKCNVSLRILFINIIIWSLFFNSAAEAEAARQKSSSYEMLDAERETAIHQDMTRPSGAVYSGLGE